MPPSPTPKWQFAPRFKRHAFGWRADTALLRLKEAMAEIKAVAKSDPALAAQGAVLLLEKLSPALEQVDDSSGRMQGAIAAAMSKLVPWVAAVADMPEHAALHQALLVRLWAAVEADQMPWIERLAEHWGALCARPDVASRWADEWLPLVRERWASRSARTGYVIATDACLATLLAARREHELLGLLEAAPRVWWHWRQWGVKALLALKQPEAALAYAEATLKAGESAMAIAPVCEALLHQLGRVDEAYRRYGLLAHQSTTHLATFRALHKHYPHIAKADLLADLVRAQPGQEGKWFAAAKDAGLYAEALALCRQSPTDPRTLTRAARDFCRREPDFAVQAGLQALRWMAAGHGYEITLLDVQDADEAVEAALSHSSLDQAQVSKEVLTLVTQMLPRFRFNAGR